MASKTEIANAAFVLLGVPPVTNVNDETGDESVTFNALFDICRLAVLRASPWRFSMKSMQLAESATESPAYDFGAAYQLPADCVHVIGTNLDIDSPWAVYERFLHADFQPTIDYNRDVGVSVFDQLATDALVLLMASRMAIPLKGSRSMKNDYYSEYQQCLNEARQSNAHERGNANTIRNSLRKAHRSYRIN